LGLLVGAHTFHNPGLVAKTAITLDHLSVRRAILGIGGAWFEREHVEYGIEFGSSPGQRLTWLVEAVAAMRPSPSWTASSLPHRPAGGIGSGMLPGPMQPRLPIMDAA
jgi:alkanesulfonate monooxygenase SsuD/methylene tetrahydromethanopterin reductase-like flavin-dependent oxidoreductase (luciferase family)